MEMSTKLKKNHNHGRLDHHDLALECCGYLKTKLFMAKRISDQQLEIDDLKDSLFNLTIKYTNLLEYIKNERSSEKNASLNQFLEEKPIKNSPNKMKNQNNNQLNKSDKVYLDENDDEIDLAKSGDISIHNVEGLFNLSNDCKSLDFEKNNNSPILENKPQIQTIKEETKPLKFIQECKGLEEEQAKEKDKRIKHLEEENLSLRKTNDILLQELNKCKMELSKVSYEKLSLFSELNEILESLSRVDLDELNKFYLESLNQNLTKSSIFSAMGIKYNILSASNTVGLHAVNHSFSFNLGNGDLLKKIDNSNSDEKNNYLGQLFSEKYLLNVREKFHKYDDDLNNYVYSFPERINRKGNNTINRNLKKNVTYNSSRIPSSVCFDSETKTDI